MATANNTIAVLFPGAQSQDVLNASEKYHLQIVEQQQYSIQKDYERYFKPSRQIFYKDNVNLLFVFPDGSVQLAQDSNDIQLALSNIKQICSVLFN